jgi:hypothetical protein
MLTVTYAECTNKPLKLSVVARLKMLGKVKHASLFVNRAKKARKEEKGFAL